MATTITPHTAARHTGTTGPSGSAAACSSEPALGSTAPTTSTATLITVSIHITATMVHIRTMETRPLITSTETRCVTGAATQAEAMQAEAIARNIQTGAQADQRSFLRWFSAMRALTSFFTRATGRGLSSGNWMVPLDVEKPLSSFLKASMTDEPGNKLQWFENAANHTSTLLYLNA